MRRRFSARGERRAEGGEQMNEMQVFGVVVFVADYLYHRKNGGVRRTKKRGRRRKRQAAATTDKKTGNRETKKKTSQTDLDHKLEAHDYSCTPIPN